MMNKNSTLSLIFIVILLVSCNSSPSSNPVSENNTDPNENTNPVFIEIPAKESGILFKNTLQEDDQYNYFRYNYFYNGGGVAVGDINNDGLSDIYFTGNQVGNKLYLNKGNLKFEDITVSSNSGGGDGWSTGVSMFDFNSDGYLDLYVCRSGPFDDGNLRKNLLYINNKDNTFTENAARYGLDDYAYSTQAYYIDFDRDQDLDIYLVNHRNDFSNNKMLSGKIARDIEPFSTDRLYLNNGDQTFTDITEQAGLLNKAWGLSASIGDFDGDGWEDIYVCNDFLEPDHLYINNGDGTFTNKILEIMQHISFYSMGSDLADFDNDGKEDLIVLDMVSDDHVRSKRNMAAMSSDNFWTMVNVGYHHQYMVNVLQQNNGSGHFSEMGQMAGISKTDWSWAPLLADFDNDGWRDLFVSNGIKRDVTDNDINIKAKNKIEELNKKLTASELLELIPTTKTANYLFKNQRDLTFKDYTDSWGMGKPINSNGAAYADLDNDGDLELITNNVDDYASIHQNQSSGNFLTLKLIGNGANLNAIGTKVQLNSGNEHQIATNYTVRGFQSSIEPTLHFGLAGNQNIEEIIVEWPDGTTSMLQSTAANQVLEIRQGENTVNKENKPEESLFTAQDLVGIGIGFVHQEELFDDYKREILLPQKQSLLGPKIAVGDVNGDNLDDFYIGGAKGQAGALYIQTGNAEFRLSQSGLWQNDFNYEDVNALFFDADNDGDNDLYIVSGGNEYEINSGFYQDRLFINNGQGEFEKSLNHLPAMTSAGSLASPGDFDNDGDLDLFIGGRGVPGKYPYPSQSYLLENNNGVFSDITQSVNPALSFVGIVTGAVWADISKNGYPDLILSGEWMPLTVFENGGSSLTEVSAKWGLDNTNGWWQSLNILDIDNDGDLDFIAGNMGKNNKFKPSRENPLHIYCHDFDQTGNLDIVLSKEKNDDLLPVRGRECSSQQMPFIKDKYPTFEGFAKADLGEIYSPDLLDEALHYEAYLFENVVLINNGNGKFDIHRLPNEAQKGPIMNIVAMDIDNDGLTDLIGGGAIWEAEIETVRYDGSLGFCLINKGNNVFVPIESAESGIYATGNVKDVVRIRMANEENLILFGINNNAPLGFFHKRPNQ